MPFQSTRAVPIWSTRPFSSAVSSPFVPVVSSFVSSPVLAVLPSFLLVPAASLPVPFRLFHLFAQFFVPGLPA